MIYRCIFGLLFGIFIIVVAVFLLRPETRHMKSEDLKKNRLEKRLDREKWRGIKNSNA